MLKSRLGSLRVGLVSPTIVVTANSARGNRSDRPRGDRQGQLREGHPHENSQRRCRSLKG